MSEMRRIMEEVALLLRLQDPDCEISDTEALRVLQIAGYDELRIERALKKLMTRLDEI
jgi:hypothetical protein